MAGRPFRWKVLVAENAPEVARTVGDLVLELADTVLVGPAADGPAALRLAASERPDAAVLDLSMPGVAGVDIVRMVREAAPRCFVVVLTAHDEPEIRAACLGAGANAFLSKAMEIARLVDVLGEGLAAAGRVGELPTDAGKCDD